VHLALQSGAWVHVGTELELAESPLTRITWLPPKKPVTHSGREWFDSTETSPNDVAGVPT